MHQWIVLKKTVLKFTLKFTLEQLRHVFGVTVYFDNIKTHGTNVKIIGAQHASLCKLNQSH